MKKTATEPRRKRPAEPEPSHGLGKGTPPIGFELEEPRAHVVFLAGGFNEWKIPLRKHTRGKWSAEVELPPGRHEYLFVVDGTWQPDPRSESVVNPFGGVNSVVTVPHANPD
jgi:1,4-alpha-glucan branching enzyme